ncbi:MAG: class I SAM-dependent methyltransferase [Burkholderiaceae bacterium]|nr:class I SAM-dependent methyltransferase [Burkholderiaceae bacterium]
MNPTASSTYAAGDAAGYELQMGRWSRRLAPGFVDFTEIEAARRIIDVGCGTGHLSLALVRSPRVEHVTGIDLSTAYVEHARSRSDDSRLEFVVGDACRLPFPDGWFDHSASMLVLQFVPDADAAVREMRRVTRRGGTVAAATWDSRGGLVFLRVIVDTAAVVDPDADRLRAKLLSQPLTRPGDLRRCWGNAGLLDVTQDMLTVRMDFECFADFWAPCEGQEGPLAAYVGRLSTDGRTRLRALVQRAYLDGEPDGPRSYAATAWMVKGKVP